MLLLLKAPKLLVLMRTLGANLMDSDRFFSLEIGLSMSTLAFVPLED